jgi:hypothetical protein
MIARRLSKEEISYEIDDNNLELASKLSRPIYVGPKKHRSISLP